MLDASVVLHSMADVHLGAITELVIGQVFGTALLAVVSHWHEHKKSKKHHTANKRGHK